MSRHRGRRRPFAARLWYFPRHCKCLRDMNLLAAPQECRSILDVHLVQTVAPR